MNPRNTDRRCVVAWAAMLLAVLGAASATGGEGGIHGRVLALDERGGFDGIVPGAVVEFRNQTLEVVATVVADQNGYYKAELPPGTYLYKVQAPGFRNEDVGRGVQLQLMDGLAVYNLSLTKGPQAGTTKPPVPVDIGTLQGRVQEKTQDGKLADVPGASVALRRTEGPPKLTRVTAGPAPDGQGGGYYTTLLEAGDWAASASAPGFETAVVPQPLNIEKGQVATWDFLLKRSQPEPAPASQGIRGHVGFADPARKPSPPQVKISVLPLDAPSPSVAASAVPDPAGNYSCNLKSGDFLLVAEAEGFRPAYAGPKVVFPGRFTVVDFLLSPLAKPEPPPPPDQLVFTASVLAATSDDVSRQTPLEGATVRLLRQGRTEDVALKAQTDRDGGAAIVVREPGRYVARAEKAGYRPAEQEVEIGGDRPARLVMVLPPETPPVPPTPPAETVLVIAVYEQGDSAQPGALTLGLRLQGEEDGARVAAVAPDSPAAKAGLQVGDLLRVIGGVRIHSPDDVIARVRQAKPGEELMIALVRQGESQRAMVTLGPAVPGGRPLPGANVRVRPPGAPLSAAVQSVTDAAGMVRLKLAGPGDYQALAVLAQYEPGGISLTVSGAGETRGEIFLRREGVAGQPPPGQSPVQPGQYHIRLTVVDQRRQPLNDAGVEVRLGERKVTSGESDASGKFSAGPLSPQRYYAVASKPGYRPAEIDATIMDRDFEALVMLQSTRMPEEEPKPPVQPSPQYNIALRVGQDTTAGVRPLPGARVEVRLGEQTVTSGVSNAEGIFFAGPVPLRPYHVVVSKTGFRTSETDLKTTGNDIHGVVVLAPMVAVAPPPVAPPQRPLANLLVQVFEYINRMQRPVPGAQIVVRIANRPVEYGQSGTDGTFTFQLPPGNYEVVVNKPDYAENRTGASLVRGDTSARIVLSRMAAGPPAVPQPPVTPGQVALHVHVAGRDAGGEMRLLPGAQVTIFRGRLPVSTLQTDQVGRTLFQLPPGEYVVGAASAGFEAKRETVTLAAQGLLHRMVLEPAAAAQPGGPLIMGNLIPLAPPAQVTLTVRVAAALARGGTVPLGNASVTVTPAQAGGDNGNARTDGGGICRFRLRPGAYQVRVQALNYHPDSAAVNLGNGDSEQGFVLQPSTDIR